MRPKAPKKTLLPPAFRLFLEKRLLEGWGLCLFALGVCITLCLATYNQQDPSWNTLTNAPPKNLLGGLGAHMADLLLQTFGFMAYGAGLVFLVWGLSFMIRHHLPLAKVRIFLLFPALILLSMGVSPLTFPVDLWLKTTPGGTVGTLLYTHLTHLLSYLPLPSTLWSWLFLMGGFGLFLFVLGIPLRLWEKAGALVLRALQGLFLLFFQALKKYYNAREQRKEQDLFETVPQAAPKKKKAPVKKTTPKTPKLPNVPTGGGYTFPPLRLLRAVSKSEDKSPVHQKVLKESGEMLKSVLEDFGIQGDIKKIHPGPVVTLYEFKPAPGTKTARVVGLASDIARSMSAISARISVIPGYNALGIELPNENRKTVYLRTLLEDAHYQNHTASLPLMLGKNIGGEPVVSDLAKMPHLLVAGTTGSGKSVSVNAMILSILYKLTPEQCRFIMIDPKMLELSIYDGIPHLLTPVVTDPHKAVMALKWAVREMETRYQAMSRIGVRNVDGYNKKIRDAQAKGETLSRKVQTGFDPETGEPTYETQEIPLKPLPYIVVIVDEMADLMLVAGKDIEAAVQRLAQMARAAGIHLIMATQRPSVDVITGTIKANFPTRISFNVTSKIDSRTILGEMGAEQLLGQGDMLFMAPGGKITRVHGPFVSDEEVERITTFLKAQGEPDYESSVTEESSDDFSGGMGNGEGSSDVLYDQALQLVLKERKASTSFIQRHLQIGYNRAARLMDRLEEEGVVSQANHVGKREVLMK